MRVLCYSPYNRWALHGQWEMTVLQGLRRRGAEVQYVLCDGLYSDCDVFWASTAPRPERACVQCQAEVINLVHSLGMEHEWLGRYLLPDEFHTARGWADGLAAADLPRATYGDWPIGEWVTASVHSHLRRSTLDVADEEVERAYRSYVYSGLVACFGLDRLLAYSRPDVLFIFNGRMSSTRVAFELAQRRGIRVVTHERGPRPEVLNLTVDERCTSRRPLQQAWSDWQDIPLTAAELEAVERLMHEREHGTGVTLRAFTAPPQPIEQVREALGLDPERRTWVLFTSSDDEVVADAEWRPVFPSQLDWVRQSVEHARDHPELDLVVRVHPNTGSHRSIGVNTEQLEELRALSRTCPPNVRWVDATDEISSYTLMEIADVGLVYHSTVGLEMACKGKPIVVAGKAHIAGTPFTRTIEDPAAYDEALAALHEIEPGTVSDEVRRLAYRFAYTMFFRLPVDFPLVPMRNSAIGDPVWRVPEDLDPGRDAGLDRCVGIILDGEPLVRPPTAEERARDDADERAFLAARRRLNVLAFADELIENGDLLSAWARTFTAADPATLVIRTPPEITERLVAAVGRAGLEGEGTADLVAVDGELETLCERVDAVYTRRDLNGALAGRPRFDDRSTDSLRELVSNGR